MEKGSGEKIILTGKIIHKPGINRLESYLVVVEKYKINEEHNRKRLSFLSYSFEQ